MPVAISLISGGLDSILATQIMLREGWDVVPLVATMPFCNTEPVARAAAKLLGIEEKLIAEPVRESFYTMLRNPQYSYGKGINPCVDCKIHICQMAAEMMEELGAEVVVTGEVVGQRPNSQQKHQLFAIANNSQIKGRLLRPLSAKLLPPTIPEEEGRINRQNLYDFSGRSRKPLLALAREFGFGKMQLPNNGCSLTEPAFAPRVRDMLDHQKRVKWWDMRILRLGRVFRLDEKTKFIVGKDAKTNAELAELFLQRETAGVLDNPAEIAYITTVQMKGPDVLVVGEVNDETLRHGAGFIRRYGKLLPGEEPGVKITLSDGREQTLEALPTTWSAEAPWI